MVKLLILFFCLTFGTLPKYEHDGIIKCNQKGIIIIGEKGFVSEVATLISNLETMSSTGKQIILSQLYSEKLFVIVQAEHYQLHEHLINSTLRTSLNSDYVLFPFNANKVIESLLMDHKELEEVKLGLLESVLGHEIYHLLLDTKYCNYLNHSDKEKRYYHFLASEVLAVEVENMIRKDFGNLPVRESYGGVKVLGKTVSVTSNKTYNLIDKKEYGRDPNLPGLQKPYPSAHLINSKFELKNKCSFKFHNLRFDAITINGRPMVYRNLFITAK